MKEWILMAYLISLNDQAIVDSQPVADHPVYTSLQDCLRATTEMPAEVPKEGKIKIYGCRTQVASKNPSQSVL